MTNQPLLSQHEYLVVDDAIFNEIGELLEERKRTRDRTPINNRVRNLMRARRKLQIAFDHHRE